MKILVLLAMFPALNYCTKAGCDAQLSDLTNSCVNPFFGGEKASEDVYKAIDKARKENNQAELTKWNEVICCVFYNSASCTREWWKRCKNIDMGPTWINILPGNYYCNRTEYPSGVCRGADLDSSLLLVFSALGFVIFYLS